MTDFPNEFSKIITDEFLNRKVCVPKHLPSIPGKFTSIFVENKTKLGFGFSSSRNLKADSTSSETNLNYAVNSHLQGQLNSIEDFKLKKQKQQLQNISKSQSRYILLPQMQTLLKNNSKTEKLEIKKRFLLKSFFNLDSRKKFQLESLKMNEIRSDPVFNELLVNKSGQKESEHSRKMKKYRTVKLGNLKNEHKKDSSLEISNRVKIKISGNFKSKFNENPKSRITYISTQIQDHIEQLKVLKKNREKNVKHSIRNEIDSQETNSGFDKAKIKSHNNSKLSNLLLQNFHRSSKRVSQNTTARV